MGRTEGGRTYHIEVTTQRLQVLLANMLSVKDARLKLEIDLNPTLQWVTYLTSLISLFLICRTERTHTS